MQTAAPTTWEDVLRMPDDGNRYEFIDGRVYMTPAPAVRHHWVSERLQSALRQILERGGHGRILYAPVLVEFPTTGDRVQPDIFFVSNEWDGVIAAKQLHGGPDLVVEILSPSTARRDRGVKLDLYARSGVREYWIVDPVEDSVDVWRFRDDPEHERFVGELPVRLGARLVGAIDLPKVFSRTTPSTWEDVLRMPADGNRYEFIGGRLYVTPAPRIRHRDVSRALQSAMRRTLQREGHGLVLSDQRLVEFPGTGDRVQPDVCFVSNERRGIVGEERVTGAPDLVAEIVSPLTAHRDRGIKLDLYARRGVREYWIVDPDEDAADVWRFGGSPGHERFTDELPVRLGATQVGTIDLGEVFAL